MVKLNIAIIDRAFAMQGSYLHVVLTEPVNYPLIEREKKETAITTLRDCIKQFAEVKKLDHSIIDDVESCNDLEKLNKLFKTLVNS